ncbi:MAG: AAA family ATPase [Deltaproteobacteria bacterium]|nr:AAA family ATPase [Deltaproteobacteria bacterium]
MRVLAIRGQNLASLPTFEIDLEHGPLADTRIFTITGPTGAGKSTLLDALCLALYDRSPRLFGAKEVLVGDLEVHGADPRSIMRRGSAEAMAEVDFIGVERRRLRATWHVWRARRALDGRIQNQRMRLIEIEDGRDRSGSTKTETLAEIERSVGLSFAEFCRAALLAQGDFAAFLRSSGDERAALLEKMTGTDIYRHLSQGAFRRAKREVEQLAELERQLDQRSLMSERDRNEVEQRLGRIVEQRRALTDAMREIQGLLEWHSNLEALEQEYEAVLRALADAERAWDEAAALRKVVNLGEQAETLRPVFEAEHRAKIQHTESVDALRSAAQNEVEAHKAKDESKDRLGRAEEARAAVLSKQQALTPRLAEARALTFQIADWEERLGQRELEAKDARHQFDEISAKRTEMERELEANNASLSEIDRWLEASASMAPLAEEWPRWQDALSRFAENQQRIEAVRGRLVAAEHAAEEERAELGGLVHQRSTLERDLECARTALHEDEQRLAEERREASPAAIQAALRRAGDEISSLERMTSIVKETAKAERARLAEARRFRAEGRGQQTQRRALSAQRRRVTKLKAYIAATALDLEVATAKNRLSKERATLLIPGEPCPLCGSRTHPREGVDEPGEARIAALRRRLRRARLKRNHVRQRARDAREAVGAHRLAMESAQARMGDLTHQLERLSEEWDRRRETLATVWVDSTLLARLGTSKVAGLIPRHPTDPEAQAALARASARLLTHHETLGAKAQEDERLGRRIIERREHIDALAAERESVIEGERVREVRSAAAQANAAAARAALQDANREQARVLEELRPPLCSRADFPDRLFDSPKTYQALCAADANAYRNARDQKVTRSEERARIQAALELLNHAWVGARGSLARADEQANETRSRLSELKAARSRHLDGRTLEEVEASAKAELERTEQAHLEAQRDFSRRSEHAARASERRSNLEERAHTAATQHVEAHARLEAAMSQAKIDVTRTELAEILGRGPEWLETRRIHVRERQAERARCEALVEDREARLRAHRDKQPASADRQALETRMKSREAELDALNAGFVTESAALKRDDEERAAVARLEPQLAAQRIEAATWCEMNSIIGSADGKKFRTFAQSLSLDALLFMANRHLAALRPRYRLSRVPGFDMELQITDLDLGEEARSISTLSGGESFLISLALALGLSSLSSHQVEVDSLFIDEGFGSLDEDALETALSVLDQLQAEGRTIGIISHVPEVAERVGYQVRVAPTSPGSSAVFIAVAR